jgi:hypothetical protein
MRTPVFFRRCGNLILRIRLLRRAKAPSSQRQLDFANRPGITYNKSPHNVQLSGKIMAI